VARHLSRYDRAADIPAMSTGLRVAHVKTAPASSILITPVRIAVRKAISSPLDKSFQFRVRNFDFMTIVF